MGSIKKALKPVTRVVDNIIPNEIKPALPYLAATFGAPYLAPAFGSLGGTGIMGAALRKGLAGAVTNLGTQVALGKNVNPVSAAVSGLFAGAGPALAGKGKFAEGLGNLVSPDKISGLGLGEAAKVASVPITAGTAEAAYDAAKEAEDAYEEYLKQQEAAGNEDIQTRVDFISRYLANAGFDQDYIDTRLNELGYAANGGLMGTRVGYESGGSLYDKASDMNRLAMEIKLIDLGYGGFGGKDLEKMSNEQIMKLYKEATSKANGGRIGYRIGGGPVKSFIAKLLGAEPSEEVLNKMFEERKKEIFNNMFDSEAGTGVYSMKQMQEADEMATKQAMQELEEFKERIGMEMENPPEGSVSDKMINQIMEPRKEGRVKEANGGRIGFKDGSNPLMEFLNNLSEKERKKALDKILDSVNISYKNPYKIFSKPKEDGENQTPGQEILKQLKDFDVLPPMDDMGYMDETMQRLLKTRRTPSGVRVDEARAEGGRIGYAEGGGSSSTEQQKRENYFDLKRDELMSLSEYLLSPMSNADLRSGKYAEGGIMNLKMGGTPTEMDLRGGGFVPIGAKEKADDVPARLSKNEFVMTADAVRAAGGGSVNKGAKRMYDLMNNLEARV